MHTIPRRLDNHLQVLQPWFPPQVAPNPGRTRYQYGRISLTARHNPVDDGPSGDALCRRNHFTYRITVSATTKVVRAANAAIPQPVDRQ